MIEKVAHVRNPLTVIAIFAGLAEVSGTIVLPLLEKGTQETYVWFLMGFPCLLISLFFGTLLHKHHVLYAPSDYKDEQIFAQMFRPATTMAIEAKIQEESGAATRDFTVEEAPTQEEPESGGEVVDSAIMDEQEGNYIRTFGRGRRIARALLAESVALQHLSAEYGIPFAQNVAIEGMSDLSFDAVGYTIDNQIVAEIVAPYYVGSAEIYRIKLRYFERLWNSLSNDRRHKTWFVLAVVITKENGARDAIGARIKAIAARFPFTITVRIYEIPEEILSEVES